ncbi:hypothetical protein MKX01_042178 [Papaver californicum]|nr:hypothetical protein MKX01_042178 [Papaver californicum]
METYYRDELPRRVWHAPWKTYRVISGNLGWVRSTAFDPSNSWFCTGSADRTIKLWDVATGRLKLTLTGHTGQVHGLAVSTQHPYMFSAGDEKQVKCWDLEQNKVIRSYHGHLSGDVTLCRVWDVRTSKQIYALSGHGNTVCSVLTRATDPQVITGSHDTTIKFWDHRNDGKTMGTLTIRNHFVSAGADNNIKKFRLAGGEFCHNMLSQQKAIVNAVDVNEEGVMATGGDDGSLWFWDWKMKMEIYALSYDITGSRLVTCEDDKTTKMWRKDEVATPETHPRLTT